MLTDLAKWLADQAVMATAPQIVPVDVNKDYLIMKDGKATLIDAQPRRRDHKARDLGAIKSFAEQYQTGSVWYSRSGVVFLFDDGDRRDRVTLPLCLSPQVSTLLELESSRRAMDQRLLILLLRTMFKDCLMDSNLIDVLRQVDWKKGEQGEQVIQRGKSSLGKSIAAEMNTQAPLPEYVALSVPIFASGFPGIRSIVEMALEPNEQTATFQFFPLPGQIEEAVARGEGALGSMLNESVSIPVRYGEPGPA